MEGIRQSKANFQSCHQDSQDTGGTHRITETGAIHLSIEKSEQVQDDGQQLLSSLAEAAYQETGVRSDKFAPTYLNFAASAHRTYGTLEYIDKDVRRRNFRLGRDETVKEKYWRVTGAMAAVMINRVLGHRWGAATNVAEIEDNLPNVESLQWIMLRYPLQIKNPSVWAKRVKEYEEMQKRRRAIYELKEVAPVSGMFKGELKDFQKVGLDWLLKMDGCGILADEMGLGKTVMALAFLATKEDALPALIVAPRVTLKNWEREIERFIQVERKEVGTLMDGQYAPPRIQVIRRGKGPLKESDFYVVNYELLEKRKFDFEKIKLRSVVFDEAHYMRNVGTQKYLAAREIVAHDNIHHRLAMTGTPLYNRGPEIWPVSDLVQPGILGTHSDFTNLYCETDWYGHVKVAPHKRKALAEMLSENIMLRRKKSEVLKDLPKIVRHREEIDVDKEYYHKEMELAEQRLEEQIGSAVTSFDLTKAWQAFNENERKIAGVAKIPAVVDYVRTVMENDEAIVIYCHHLVVHEALLRHFADKNPAHIIGGLTDNKLYNNMDLFQKGKTNLLIAGIRAGNVGVSFHRASYVIFAELDWTPSVHKQAEGRLHRIGQQKTVFAYYLHGKDTMDDDVVKKLTDKTLEIDEIMGDSNDPLKQQENDESRAREIMAKLKTMVEKKKQAIKREKKLQELERLNTE